MECVSMSELLNNREQRIQSLKDIVRKLHEGHPPEFVRADLRTLVHQCDAIEIAQMEQKLIADGIPVHEIMRMCDMHAQVVSEVMNDPPHVTLHAGHPVRVFQKENGAIQHLIEQLRSAMEQLVSSTDKDPAEQPPHDGVLRCRQLINELMDIEKHYDRKENLLFSMLERHGIDGPSKVMWGKDDEVRAQLRRLRESVFMDGLSRSQWDAVLQSQMRPALSAVEEMIRKEEHILFPMSMDKLTEHEWGEIWTQSPQYGWCLIEPEDGYVPPRAERPETDTSKERDGFALSIVPPANGRVDPPNSAVMFPTGAMTPEQMIAMFSVLPVDLTFVDADDRVRFFSEGQRRIFVRPKAVIGRKVQHCHPPSSVGVVDEILEDFRSGRQDVADFWLEHKGRFVFIRYFAMRDEHGRYMGTLEVSQDLTRERKLQGERRLLTYDTPAAVL